MIVVSITYPNAAGARFDWNYYQGTHLPMVGRKLGGFGLASASVLKGEQSADGGAPAYTAIAFLSFSSLENANLALASSEARELMADIANFTDVIPVIQLSSAVP